jgi:hypothetical protein
MFLRHYHSGKTFQQMMDRVIAGLGGVFCYLNDILVTQLTRSPIATASKDAGLVMQVWASAQYQQVHLRPVSGGVPWAFCLGGRRLAFRR